MTSRIQVEVMISGLVWGIGDMAVMRRHGPRPLHGLFAGPVDSRMIFAFRRHTCLAWAHSGPGRLSFPLVGHRVVPTVDSEALVEERIIRRCIVVAGIARSLQNRADKVDIGVERQ